MSSDNGNGADRWTERDVQGILLNPVHTMGSRPSIDDEAWISTQKQLQSELGDEKYFRELLTVIQDTFGEFVS